MIEDREVVGRLPFRSWRTHCVRGKGREQARFRQPEREYGLPEARLDYAFIGSRSEKNDAGDSKLMPVLVMKEKQSKMTMASVIPKKGSFGVFASKRAASCLKEIGLDKADIVIKFDQEAAVGALVDDIKRMRNDSRPVVEHSPIRTPESNGLIERSVMSIKEQVKVMKSALEARWQRNIS